MMNIFDPMSLYKTAYNKQRGSTNIDGLNNRGSLSQPGYSSDTGSTSDDCECGEAVEVPCPVPVTPPKSDCKFVFRSAKPGVDADRLRTGAAVVASAGFSNIRVRKLTETELLIYQIQQRQINRIDFTAPAPAFNAGVYTTIVGNQAALRNVAGGIITVSRSRDALAGGSKILSIFTATDISVPASYSLVQRITIAEVVAGGSAMYSWVFGVPNADRPEYIDYQPAAVGNAANGPGYVITLTGAAADWGLSVKEHYYLDSDSQTALAAHLR